MNTMTPTEKRLAITIDAILGYYSTGDAGRDRQSAAVIAKALLDELDIERGGYHLPTPNQIIGTGPTIHIAIDDAITKITGVKRMQKITKTERQWNSIFDELEIAGTCDIGEDEAQALYRGSYHNLQSDISEWSRDTFGSSTKQVLTKLGAEYQELISSIDIEIDPNGIAMVHEHDTGKEAADVLFMLFQLAENIGFNLLEETRKKFDINRNRQWEARPDGTFQHI